MATREPWSALSTCTVSMPNVNASHIRYPGLDPTDLPASCLGPIVPTRSQSVPHLRVRTVCVCAVTCGLCLVTVFGSCHRSKVDNVVE